MLPDQVRWLSATTQSLSRVPGVLFMHIPPSDTMYAWNNFRCYGWINDSQVACQTLNTGLFSAVQESSINAIAYGHSHGDDFECDYYNNITLFFGRHSGYGGYPYPDQTPQYTLWERGVRVMVLHQGWCSGCGRVRAIIPLLTLVVDGSPMQSWIRLGSGVKPRGPLHLPSANNVQPVCYLDFPFFSISGNNAAVIAAAVCGALLGVALITLVVMSIIMFRRRTYAPA